MSVYVKLGWVPELNAGPAQVPRQTRLPGLENGRCSNPRDESINTWLKWPQNLRPPSFWLSPLHLARNTGLVHFHEGNYSPLTPSRQSGISGRGVVSSPFQARFHPVFMKTLGRSLDFVFLISTITQIANDTFFHFMIWRTKESKKNPMEVVETPAAMYIAWMTITVLALLIIAFGNGHYLMGKWDLKI